MNNDDTTELKIVDDKGNIVKVKTTMKVLGIKINCENNMRTHLSHMMSKIVMTYNKVRDALPFASQENCKVIINSKVRGQNLMFLPLMINQTQAVNHQAQEHSRWKAKTFVKRSKCPSQSRKY